MAAETSVELSRNANIWGPLIENNVAIMPIIIYSIIEIITQGFFLWKKSIEKFKKLNREAAGKNKV